MILTYANKNPQPMKTIGFISPNALFNKLDELLFRPIMKIPLL